LEWTAGSACKTIIRRTPITIRQLAIAAPLPDAKTDGVAFVLGTPRRFAHQFPIKRPPARWDREIDHQAGAFRLTQSSSGLTGRTT
jgi:hypothetical protein